MTTYSLVSTEFGGTLCRYRHNVPTEEELKKEIERERFNLEQKFEDKNGSSA